MVHRRVAPFNAPAAGTISRLALAHFNGASVYQRRKAAAWIGFGQTDLESSPQIPQQRQRSIPHGFIVDSL